MNIALIGPPGSGKSDLAAGLAAKLHNAVIVDNYVQIAEDRTQIAMGPMADYLGNLYVALDRYALERIARLDEGNAAVITCGTLIETAVYMALHFTGQLNVLDEEGKADIAPKVDAVLRILAVLYSEIFNYDFAFYLPAPRGNEDTEFMDHQLQAGLAGFKLVPIMALESSDPETRLQEALEVINGVPTV